MKNLYTERTKTVTKSNDLIQKGRFNLSLIQQRTLLYMISQVDPGANEFAPVKIDLAEFCAVCGIDRRRQAEIKSEISKMGSLDFWVDIEGHSKRKTWISSEYEADIEWGSGEITLKLSESVRPYILSLHEKFTTYQLQWVLAFRKSYSIRLYEYTCSRHFHDLETYTFSIEPKELQSVMGAENYRFADFHKFALAPAVKEINEYSDKKLEYSFKTGKNRQVIAIEITISEQDPITRAEHERRNQVALGINPDQLTMWDYLDSIEAAEERRIARMKQNTQTE